MSLVLKCRKFQCHGTISKSSRLGVGSLIRGRASYSLRTVSGDLRRFFGCCSIKGSKNLYENLLVQRKSHHTVTDYIRFFQNGEEKGFNFFFREFYAALSYYSFQIIKDKPAAEEIASEALMKLWERHENFDNLSAIKSFLYTTTRNASLNYIRSQERVGQRLKDVYYLSDKNEKDAFERIAETETYRGIFMALNTLPPQCRKIFSMLYIEGKEYQQIADELNLTVATIRSQKARAIMLIKQRLALCWPLLILLS